MRWFNRSQEEANNKAEDAWARSAEDDADSMQSSKSAVIGRRGSGLPDSYTGNFTGKLNCPNGTFFYVDGMPVQEVSPGPNGTGLTEAEIGRYGLGTADF